jgi:serine/threonine protein kinase/Tfp pilus assembly protein PilF
MERDGIMPFEIGQTVGPYRITEQLGQGGMATVYRAYHASLDRYVAIKVLHAAFQNDENFNLRFQREAQIVARLEHPHIVPVYDFETGHGDPYIVMKFIEGQTLKHRFRDTPLTLEETLEIIPAVAAALSYAHVRGILHRDVKPSNVMMDQADIPYLADFGLARMVTSGESTMSQDVLIGTPNYISPEQAKGVKILEPTTDIYSLGIMIYEIVVGRVPFSADTPFAVVHDHIYKPLPMPTLVNPTVPPQVETVLLKALSKEPKDRYQTAIELSNAFKEAVTAANMSELSAASIHLERFQDSVPTTINPTTVQDLNTAIRAAIAEALPQQLNQNQPAIPGMTGSWPPAYGSSVQVRRRGLGRAFWILIGAAILVFTCIAGLAITMDALNNPIVRGMPVEAAEDVLATPVPDYLNIDVNMSMEEAEAMVAEDPDNPMAHMILGLRYRELGQMARAAEEVQQVVSNPETPAEIFVVAATTAAQLGFVDDAMFLWMAAYQRDPLNAQIRNDAGQYIYRNLQNASEEAIQGMLLFAGEQEDATFLKTMEAHAVLSSRRVLLRTQQNRVKSLLDDALVLDNSLAETHLIYGNYYAKIDDPENAEQSWRFASSFADSPEWVQREVEYQRSVQASDQTDEAEPTATVGEE